MQHEYSAMLILSRDAGLDGVKLLIERALVQSCLWRYHVSTAETRAELVVAARDLTRMAHEMKAISRIVEVVRRRGQEADLDPEGNSPDGDLGGESYSDADHSDADGDAEGDALVEDASDSDPDL
jgi:hypothetical protein